MAFRHGKHCDEMFYSGCSCVERAENNLAFVAFVAILVLGIYCLSH